MVVTTGTSLAGRVIVGETAYPAGRAGEFAAYGLSQSLRNLGFTLGRLKTGTPPRLDARTIDFSQTILSQAATFPFISAHPQGASFLLSANPIYPREADPGGRSFPAIWSTPTRDASDNRANLHAPLYPPVSSRV